MVSPIFVDTGADHKTIRIQLSIVSWGVALPPSGGLLDEKRPCQLLAVFRKQLSAYPIGPVCFGAFVRDYNNFLDRHLPHLLKAG